MKLDYLLFFDFIVYLNCLYYTRIVRRNASFIIGLDHSLFFELAHPNQFLNMKIKTCYVFVCKLIY